MHRGISIMHDIDIPPGNINKKVSVKERRNEVTGKIYGFILSLKGLYQDGSSNGVFDRT